MDSPTSLGDLCHISLIGSIYKLMKKVLTSKLAKVTNKLSSNQSTFLKGIFLIDGIVVVNELIDLAKKIKKECLIFKVDFE